MNVGLIVGVGMGCVVRVGIRSSSGVGWREVLWWEAETQADNSKENNRMKLSFLITIVNCFPGNGGLAVKWDEKQAGCLSSHLASILAGSSQSNHDCNGSG